MNTAISRPNRRSRLRLAVTVLAITAALCAVPVTTAGAAGWTVTGSWGQVFVTHGTTGDTVTLRNSGGTVIDTGTIDDLGSLVFRKVPAGSGYVVQSPTDGTSAPFVVHDPAGGAPPSTLYTGQTLDAGFSYITTRDGTKLSASVYLPGPAADGPYPTVIEYSGYDPSRPNTSLADQYGLDANTRNQVCPVLPVVCSTPAQPGSELAYAMGFAVVAVNIRGTGCSGGAFDFFDDLQRLDGYDVVETVAAQPWAKNHRVGMVGLSYPGISQLYVAREQPPSLAAIAPFSVIDDTARSTLAPGGMFNSGFALRWASEVTNRAQPYGQGWEQGRVNGGDTQCAENQLMRHQNVDAVEKARSYSYYEADVADPVNPTAWASRINVPVLMAGAWQDDQTGGHFPYLFSALTNAPVKKLIAYNGAHADGYTGEVLVDLKAFLDFYVNGARVPLNPLFFQAAPYVLSQTFGASPAFPADRWLGPTGQADFEASPDVRVIFERGATSSGGPDSGTAQATYPSWPVAGTDERWYFNTDGSITSTSPTATLGAVGYQPDTSRGPVTIRNGQDPFKAEPAYNWLPDTTGAYSGFETAPLPDDRTYVGSGSVDLWVKSTINTADLQADLTEVRPDGTEIFVQSGWLRTKWRATNPGTTPTRPFHGGYEADARLLTPDRWSQARVELFPFAHIFRAGSRLRVTVHSPGGTAVEWGFDIDPTTAGSQVQVGTSRLYPSSINLNRVTNPSGYPATAPACPTVNGKLVSDLRGQACRNAVPIANTVTEAAGDFFVPITPQRLRDTRYGIGGSTGIIPAGQEVRVPLAGAPSIPNDAAAVAVNVTLTRTAGSGYARVWPCDTTEPAVSTVNASTAGQTIANSTLVAPGPSQAVCIRSSTAAHVVVDATGYHPANSGVVLTQKRLVDTRSGIGGPAGPVPAGTVRHLADAQWATHEGAALNVTVSGATGVGYVQMWACSSGGTPTSAVNFGAGVTVANFAVVGTGGGDICYRSTRSAHILIDLVGLYPNGSPAVPDAPARIYDSRSSGGPFAAGETRRIHVAGVAGIDASAHSVALNLTASNSAPGAGFVTAWPCGTTRPNASALNPMSGRAVANTTLVGVGDGGDVCVYSWRPTQLVADVSSWEAKADPVP